MGQFPSLPSNQREFPRRDSESSGMDITRHMDPNLRLDNMLLEEFSYASSTAYQAMEDRARLFNLYLLLVGVLASGLSAAYQLGGGVRLYLTPIAITLLSVAGVLGTAFFVSLIRLRLAHSDSLVCMGVIKEYYIRQFEKEMPNVGDVFWWRLRTAPKRERFGSATFVVCHTVAMLGSLCFSAAIGILSALALRNNRYLIKIPQNLQPLSVAALAFILLFFLHASYFQKALRGNKDTRLEALFNEIAAMPSQ